MPAAGRPDLHILARLLGLATAPAARPLTRSRFQRASRLNHTLFAKYLQVLLDRGLLERRPGPPETFAPTEEGRRVHAELGAWLARLFGGAL